CSAMAAFMAACVETLPVLSAPNSSTFTDSWVGSQVLDPTPTLVHLHTRPLSSLAKLPRLTWSTNACSDATIEVRRTDPLPPPVRTTLRSLARSGQYPLSFR